MIRTVSALAATALVLATGELRAEERDLASAQALFDQGMELMSAGKYAEACPKLAESQRLDAGIGTQFHLAGCYEQLGKIASAWALFLEVASVARATNQSDRENVANARARRLEGRLPKLIVVVPDAARVPGLEIRRDGIVVGSAQWGTPVPFDPGAHEMVVSAPGRSPETRAVEAREKESVTFEAPVLSPAPTSAATPATAPEAATTPEAKDEGGTKPMALILGLGGLGIVGVGVGTAFGLMASSDNQDSLEHCRDDAPNVCQPEGVSLRESAMKKGNIATVSFAVGGAALIGAGVLWLVSGSSGEAKESGALNLEGSFAVGPREAGLLLRGAF